MKTIGDYNFPETEDECNEWRPDISSIALHSEVLVVAKTRIEGTWKAYCAPVAGVNHKEEIREVLRNGVEVYEEYAVVMFPIFEGVPYAK